MLEVAIGPETRYPSWQWIGPDSARALGGAFKVKRFRRTPDASAQVVLVVKHGLASSGVRRALDRGQRILYMPIDLYESPEAIAEHAELLGRCAALLVHSERLRPHLAPYARTVWSIDHHNRFGLPIPPPFRPDGPILWTGGFQYAPYLLKWIETHPLPSPLVLLTDYDNPWARNAFDRLIGTLGLAATWVDGSRWWRGRSLTINGHVLERWSPRRQKALLEAAAAAIDIKGPDFNQLTKPPTKAQLYVASGLPTAVNGDSYSWEHFAARGFNLATPDDGARWRSQAYWRETAEQATHLARDLSLESISRRLIDYVRRVADVRP